jgi:hypothetical protein
MKLYYTASLGRERSAGLFELADVVNQYRCFRHQMLLSCARHIILNRERCRRVDEREHDPRRCQKERLFPNRKSSAAPAAFQSMLLHGRCRSCSPEFQC